jgi:hypothetical protein
MIAGAEQIERDVVRLGRASGEITRSAAPKKRDADARLRGHRRAAPCSCVSDPGLPSSSKKAASRRRRGDARHRGVMIEITEVRASHGRFLRRRRWLRRLPVRRIRCENDCHRRTPRCSGRTMRADLEQRQCVVERLAIHESKLRQRSPGSSVATSASI